VIGIYKHMDQRINLLLKVRFLGNLSMDVIFLNIRKSCGLFSKLMDILSFVETMILKVPRILNKNHINVYAISDAFHT
jgi:hypothetical protein